MLPPPPRSTLFPYTTLFRSFRAWLHVQLEQPPEGVRRALRRSVWSRDGRDNDDGPIDRIRRAGRELAEWRDLDRKSTRLNSSHSQISYAVFCLKKKKQSRKY